MDDRLRNLDLCMIDNRGRRVAEPLLHMQSEEVLRDLIRRGYRTDECFSEIRSRNERWHAAKRVIERARSETCLA